MTPKSPSRGQSKMMTGAQIRQSYLDFFAARGHAIVASASLVPGTDPTLLFTNSGMVQFKDVFLGTGSRPYTRVADSQKCMRVAGKHNDLDDVGRDDYHHTFFEMLGNWSFGDYYKEEAIAWAWELLTEVWGLPRESLWATCFEDEHGEIPRDDEAADAWRRQVGFDPSHVLFFGRKDNFWEMADIGPCGPDSEVHIDRGPAYCDKMDEPGHECRVNGGCARFLELWNLVFIQYNRLGPAELRPLPKKHVDTGMGLERIVSVLQGVASNYRTDLLSPLMDKIQELAGHDARQREASLTPYRVIADHTRGAAFLIADGVVPGNTGRNYVCRMIIRRASRFGGMIGFEEPFLASVAVPVIDNYGAIYPELVRNRTAILQTLNDEERRFRHTVDTGLSHLTNLLDGVTTSARKVLDGESAFNLYATYGLPLEITRDIARERGLEVDDAGFRDAMEAHRLASGAGMSLGGLGEADVDFYRTLLTALSNTGDLPSGEVVYDPYDLLEASGTVLALVKDGQTVTSVEEGQEVGLVLPRTGFYLEAGGQVADTGIIQAATEPGWRIRVERAERPVAGLIVHIGRVEAGSPRVGDPAVALVDRERRWDIMRNHTATHLLHASLRAVLGEHARQAGSLVAPDRLRFDFTHPQAMSPDQIQRVERMVNEAVLSNYALDVQHRSREEAVAQGAMALFGETYGETVRTVSIGAADRFSFELCGGTHVPETGVIGPFLILSEGSAAAGIRRIEAVTGRQAIRRMQAERDTLRGLANTLGSDVEALGARAQDLLRERDRLERSAAELRQSLAKADYEKLQAQDVRGVPVLTGEIRDSSAEVLRLLLDQFRAEHPTGVAVLGSVADGRPILVGCITEDLLGRGLHAGELLRAVAKFIGGSGGGKATIAQAGGKDPSKLPEALAAVKGWVGGTLS